MARAYKLRWASSASPTSPEELHEASQAIIYLTHAKNFHDDSVSGSSSRSRNIASSLLQYFSYFPLLPPSLRRAVADGVASRLFLHSGSNSSFCTDFHLYLLSSDFAFRLSETEEKSTTNKSKADWIDELLMMMHLRFIGEMDTRSYMVSFVHRLWLDRPSTLACFLDLLLLDIFHGRRMVDQVPIEYVFLYRLAFSSTSNSSAISQLHSGAWIVRCFWLLCFRCLIAFAASSLSSIRQLKY
jgi:hypothetical protein